MTGLYIFLIFMLGFFVGRKSAIKKLFISESEAFNKLEKELDKSIKNMEAFEKGNKFIFKPLKPLK